MKNFLMSVLIAAIFVVLGAIYWYQTTFDTRIMDMNNRAGAIEEKYQSFTKDLHVLDMKFIGRAKHVQTNKDNIKQLFQDIDDFKNKHAEDLFTINTKIDSLGGVVDANNNSVNTQIDALKKTIQNLRKTVSQNNITTTTRVQKVIRDIQSIEKRLDKVELLTEDKKEKKKGLF